MLGVIVSIFASFFTDARRGIARWRRERKERERNEADELFEKAKLYEMKGEPEKAAEYFNRVLRSVPDMEEAYMRLLRHARGEGRACQGRSRSSSSPRRASERRKQILLKKAQIHRAQQDLDAVERDLQGHTEDQGIEPGGDGRASGTST